MAIYQRDRNFHQIFTEIDIDVIPLKFIRDITCYLTDGRKVVLDEKDFQNKSDDKDLETLIKNLGFYEQMSDLQIRINYDRVEKDVEADVARLLKNHD